MARRLALCVALAALAWGGAARASVFDSFGFDPRGVAMGGAQVSTADDYTAAYFNPSLLVLQKEMSFGAGFSFVQPRLGVAAQDLGQASRLNLAANPPDFGGLTMGVVFPLGGKVKNRLALGLGTYMPTNNMLRTEGVDPASPFWYRYQSAPDRIIFAVGAGLRLTDAVQLGAGAQFLGGFGGGFDFKLDPFNKTFEHRELRTDLLVRGAPVAGLTVDLARYGLRFGASYRGALKLDYSLPTSFELTDVGTIIIGVDGYVHYTPHTFTFGAQYRRGLLTATAELRWSLWSKAPDPSTVVTMKMEGEAIDALGLPGRFDAGSEARSPGFADTLAPHFGLEYQLAERVALRGGYFFRPTPVPLQGGDTNILDGDTHGIGLGAAVQVDDPLEVFAKPIHIELAYQRLIIPQRVAEKAPDDPLPSYAYSGGVNNLTLAVRYVF